MIRWRRLVCRVRGHRRVQVIERAAMFEVTPSGPGFRVAKSHFECRRCGARLEGGVG